MPIVLNRRRNSMTLRRRIQIRVQTFARTASKAWFWMRNGHTPVEAWKKAWVTL